MRDKVGRILLACMGGAAVVVGLSFVILGPRDGRHLGTYDYINAIGAVANGAVVVRIALRGWTRAA